jgi:hypothetical protein
MMMTEAMIADSPPLPPFLDDEHKFHVVPVDSKLERSIKFGWHFDDEFPIDGRTTYHSIWVGKNRNRQESDPFARCTAIVLESEIHNELFLAYYQVKFDQTPNPKKSPVGLNKLKMHIFNRDLGQLKIYLDEFSTAMTEDDTDDRVPSLYERWWNKLSGEYRHKLWSSCPDRFMVILVNADSNDLYFWRTKTIHAVTKWSDDLVQTKVYIGVKPQIEDKSVSTSAGSFKAGARKWEQKHAPETVTEERIQAHLQVCGDTPSISVSSRRQWLFQHYGIICFPNITNSTPTQHFHLAILDYARRLVGLPEHINLNDPHQAAILTSSCVREEFKIPADHVRRNGSNTRSTHFSKSCGISGYGFHSNAVNALARLCLPYINWVNNYACQLRAIDFAIQAPVIESKVKKTKATDDSIASEQSSKRRKT